MCFRTTSAQRSRDSMMVQGCDMSTTIITVVSWILDLVSTNESSWLCQTTPSKIHTLIRSTMSAVCMCVCVCVCVESAVKYVHEHVSMSMSVHVFADYLSSVCVHCVHDYD